MPLSKDELIAQLDAWGIQQETISHALSPTCPIHSENIKGTAFERFIGKGQAKNLFFKVPSSGGPLKNRLFLICALVETDVDNKQVSTRLGIKASAPLRLAADEIFEQVLQVPKGSVTPFVMANSSANEVTLLLDDRFQSCEKLLFHPMQSDFTTALAPDQLSAFLDQCCAGRWAYVNFESSAPISLPTGGAKAAEKPPAKSAPAKKEKAPANAKTVEKPPAKSAPAQKAPAKAAVDEGPKEQKTPKESVEVDLSSVTSNQWNDYLAQHMYLGGDICATLVDYKQHEKIRAADVNEEKFPHLFRWHLHIAFLKERHQLVDFRGVPIPAGKQPTEIIKLVTKKGAAP